MVDSAAASLGPGHLFTVERREDWTPRTTITGLRPRPNAPVSDPVRRVGIDSGRGCPGTALGLAFITEEPRRLPPNPTHPGCTAAGRYSEEFLF
nr:hypothetical protein KitaXyl93_25600 [Kitasatospora sp. Xyl93]